MSDEISIILADDHVLFREGLAQILDTEPDIIIVAQASTGREALSRLKEKGANLVVMDISMPDMDGIEATKMIASEYPNVAVLVLSAHEDSKSLFSSIEAGARGYLLKDSAPHELAAAIREVAGGGSVVSQSMTPKLLQGVREIGYDPVQTERRRFNLSDREMEILEALATSKSPNQIGRELYISTKTVQNHISNVYRKLEVNSRTEAVMKSLELGLTSKDQAFFKQYSPPPERPAPPQPLQDALRNNVRAATIGRGALESLHRLELNGRHLILRYFRNRIQDRIGKPIGRRFPVMKRHEYQSRSHAVSHPCKGLYGTPPAGDPHTTPLFNAQAGCVIRVDFQAAFRHQGVQPRRAPG